MQTTTINPDKISYPKNYSARVLNIEEFESFIQDNINKITPDIKDLKFLYEHCASNFSKPFNFDTIYKEDTSSPCGSVGCLLGEIPLIFKIPENTIECFLQPFAFVVSNFVKTRFKLTNSLYYHIFHPDGQHDSVLVLKNNCSLKEALDNFLDVIIAIENLIKK